MNKKLIFAILVLLVALGFTGWRLSRVMKPAMPTTGFVLEKRSSPTLASSTRAPIRDLLRQAQTMATERGVPVVSLHAIQLGPKDEPDKVWFSETLRNGVFEPLRNFERSVSGGQDVKLLGYYTLQGDPLEFTAKTHPERPERTFVTIHLPAAISPGATQTVFRVEQRTNLAQATGNGIYTVRVGGADARQRGIHIRAIQLPAHAKVVSVQPANVPPPKGIEPLIAWIGTEKELNRPLVVQFRY